MNKDEIVNILSQRTGFMKKDSETLLGAAFQIITEALVSGEKVQIANFGTFEVKHRAPRTGRNPRANVPVPIPAKRVPSFKPSKSLKALIESSK
jgi:DNA-binding protein HU-beta